MCEDELGHILAGDGGLSTAEEHHGLIAVLVDVALHTEAHQVGDLHLSPSEEAAGVAFHLVLLLHRGGDGRTGGLEPERLAALDDVAAVVGAEAFADVPGGQVSVGRVEVGDVVGHIRATADLVEGDGARQRVAHHVPAVGGGYTGVGVAHRQGDGRAGDVWCAGDIHVEGRGGGEAATAPGGEALTSREGLAGAGGSGEAIVHSGAGVGLIVPTDAGPQDAAAHGAGEVGAVRSGESGGVEVVLQVVHRLAGHGATEHAPVGGTCRDVAVHDEFTGVAGGGAHGSESASAGGVAGQGHGVAGAVELAILQQQGVADGSATGEGGAIGRVAGEVPEAGGRSQLQRLGAASREGERAVVVGGEGTVHIHHRAIGGEVEATEHEGAAVVHGDGAHLQVGRGGDGVPVLHHHVGGGVPGGCTRGAAGREAPDGVAHVTGATAVVGAGVDGDDDIVGAGWAAAVADAPAQGVGAGATVAEEGGRR